MSSLQLAVLVTCLCQAAPASRAMLIPHPDDASKSVEFFVEEPAGQRPWPTVVFLHGHQESPRPGGRDFADWGVLKQFAERGYLAVAVSQPGYGKSTGPADFSGPLTQHAVSAVIAKLRADGEASPGKLLIQGISRGALTAGLVAAHDKSISGLVLISGVYDLSTYAADQKPNAIKLAVLGALKSETGGTPETLEARSLLRFAGQLKAKTLILNGAKDDRADPDQSRLLADEITRQGGAARAIIYPDLGHKIPVDVRNKDINPFIDDVLKASRDP